MKLARSGKQLALFIIACLLTHTAQATLFASMDRYRIAMGDTVRLTLRSDDERDPADADLSGLEEHFEVLQRSSSVSTRIVNGQRSQNRELILELTPRREGSIVIPPFTVDGVRSEALAVEIAPEPQAQAGDEIATFEAELDRSSVFVQGQLLLTLRVQQAVNLESRSITDLDIDNAYVESLGQNSFQRVIDGRPWLVHEIRYAIFPEASGELVIPAQTFSGRLGSGRRTLFDTRPAGRLVRRRTEEIRVEVQPRPASFPDATWLPAADLNIEEQWSAPLDGLKIGDSITRTITITGEGLQGAQLPPIGDSEVDGLRIYPDQPSISNVSSDSGVTGVRSDSIALVAVTDGEYELPAIEIPWWDTASNTMRTARLPARRLRVLPPPGAEIPVTQPEALPQTATPVTVVENAGAGPWPWVAGLCALGWVLTTILLLRRGREPHTDNPPAVRETPRQLLKACADNDAIRARAEVTAWIRGLAGAQAPGLWLQKHGSAELKAAITELDGTLYGPSANGNSWQGEKLAGAIQAFASSTGPAADPGSLPALYASS